MKISKGINILKSFYKDNLDNRKKGRVGQKYGGRKKVSHINKDSIIGSDEFFHSATLREKGYKLPWTGKVGDKVTIEDKKGFIVGSATSKIDGEMIERPLINISGKYFTNTRYKNLSINEENEKFKHIF